LHSRQEIERHPFSPSDPADIIFEFKEGPPKLSATLMATINTRLFPPSRALHFLSRTKHAVAHTAPIQRRHPSIPKPTRRITTAPPPKTKMSTPIPLATLGANPDVAKEIQALLLPEYDRASAHLPSPPSLTTQN
jgi:hypothetical protein